MTLGSLARRLALGLALMLAAGPALAQGNRQEDAGKVGNGRILKIWEGGRFDRCAVEFVSPSGAARLAFNTERRYALSVPPPNFRVTGLLTMTVDVRGRSFGNDAATNGQRAWIGLNNDLVQALLNHHGPLVVWLDRQQLQWPVTVPMGQVFRAVEDCLNRGVGWR